MTHPFSRSIDRASHSASLARRVGTTAAVVLLASVVACDRSGVEERAVPKGAERMPADPETPASAPDEADPSASVPTRSPWTVPAGWIADPEPRPMRLATFVAPDPGGAVEVAITRFAGRVGGELANINRWRGQMGLGPIEETELEPLIDRFESPGYEGYTVRIESAGGVMLAAGVYDAAIDQTWFVRATVPDAAAADRMQAELFAMARSIASPSVQDDG